MAGPEGLIARVQHGEERQRLPPADGSYLGVDLELVLEDGELQRNPELRRRQSDARGLVHHAAHQVDQVTEFGIAQLAIEGRSHMPQDRMPGLDNRRKNTRAENLLDGLANPGGAVVGGDGVKGHVPRLLAGARRCNKS